MRSLLSRKADSYAVHYGEAPLISFDKAKENMELSRESQYVGQIKPMRIERVDEDYFGMDEVDRAELRRMESDKSRELAPYVRRETDRMESEGNILGDESVDAAHIQRAVDNVMTQLDMNRQPEGYLEDLVRLLILNEIFDRRRRCRRRGSCRL